MNLKKSKTSVRKLFWAVCILGSGINIHAVESSTGTSKIFVRPNSVEEADRMLLEAAWKGDVELMERLIQAGNPQVTQQAVQKAFENAARYRNENVVSWLLREVTDERRVTQQPVQEAFGVAARNGRTDMMEELLELNDGRKVTAQTVQEAFEHAARYEHTNMMEELLELNDGRKVTAQTVQSTLLAAAENGSEQTVKYLLSQDHIAIEPQVLQRAFNKLVSNMDLKDLAEIHFPKEVYENSKELSARLAKNPLSGDELKAIMAIGTQDGRTSDFAEHLMSEQHYQDAMALIKVREQGATGISRLPKKGLFREVAMYGQPRIAGARDGQENQEESKEPDQAKKGGQQNQEESKE